MSRKAARKAIRKAAQRVEEEAIAAREKEEAARDAAAHFWTNPNLPTVTIHGIELEYAFRCVYCKNLYNPNEIRPHVSIVD